MNETHVNCAPLATAALADGLVAELWSRAAYESRDPGGTGVIGFAFERQDGEDAIASDRVRSFRREANTLAWIPPGCPVFSKSRLGGEYLLLRGFPSDAIGHPDAPGRAVNDAVDADAVRAARALRRWLLGSQAGPAPPAMDLLRAALLARFQRGPGRSAGWLTSRRVASIERFIAGHIGERIEVGDLAAELGLSIGFLVLAFRARLGTTPHRYLMERRIAHARAALAMTAEPVATIARAAGFADQAHLTRSMRAALDTTPAAYRRLRQLADPSACPPLATRL